MRATINAQQPPVAPAPPGGRPSRRRAKHLGAAWRLLVRSPLLLVPILCLGLGLRLHGLNWDDGYHLHPDERFITIVITERILPDWPPRWGDLLDPDHSPLNARSDDPTTGQPRDFAYGSLPLFVTKAVAGGMRALTHTPWTDYDHIFLVGRALSALLDVGTVLLVSLLARRYGRAWANLAALLFACCVLPIQLAHFFATDSWVTFFATAAVWAFLRAAERGATRDFLVGGALTGAAVASKASVAFLAFPAVAAIGVAWWADRRAARAVGEPSPGLQAVFRALSVFWAAVVTFAICEPYALFRIRTYVQAIGTQAKLARGDLDYPYTRQYVGTGLLYHVKNLVLWGMGPSLGALVLVGVAVALLRVWRRHAPADVLLVAWAVPYLAYTIPQSVKFMRYLEPVYPALIVLGVALLRDAVAARRLPGIVGRRRIAGYLRRGAYVIGATVACATLLWAFAFSTIYDRQHSRVAASDWMATHIPAGSTMATEVWDDALPLPIPDAPAYNCVRMNANTPSQCTGLDLYPDEGSGDLRLQYVVGALAQSDYIVESSNRLYGSIPKLPWRYPVTIRYYQLLFAGKLGFTTVYDQTVSPHIGPWRIDDQHADESFTVYDQPRVTIFQKTEALSISQLRPLFADVLDIQAIPQRASPGKSLLLNQPVETLPAVSDRGWAGATGRHAPVAIAAYLLLFEVFGIIGWVLAAEIFHAFPDRGWGLAKLVGWAGTAWVVWIGASLRFFSFTRTSCFVVVFTALLAAAVVYAVRRARVGAVIRHAWPAMVAAEIVSLCGFALFIAFRFRNPDLWQTYWGGEKPFELAHLNAILRSAHFPPYDPWYAGGYINYYYFGSYLHAFAMKLTGIPPEVAFNVALPMTMALVWGAAFSVGAALSVLVRRQIRVGWIAPIGGGVAATAMVGLFGNLDAVGQLARALKGGEHLRAATERFDFWESTRIIPGTINEFPYFSGLYADLHAHLVALPFAILVAGLSIAIAVHWRIASMRSAPRLSQTLRGAPWLVMLLAALIVGMLYPTNAWDFPTAAGLIFLGLTAGQRRIGIGWPRALTTAIIGAGGVAMLGVLLFLPFFAHFQSLYGSVARVREPSPLGPFLAIFGVQILALALGIVMLRPAGGWYGLFARDRRCGAIAGITAFGVVLAALTQRLVLVVTAPLLGALAVLWLRADRQPGRRMAYGIAAIGLGLLSAIELVFLADDLIGGDFERMNTVFKFDFQAWWILAFGVVALAGIAWERWRMVAPSLQTIAGAVVVCGVVASLGYPLLGTPVRLAQRMPNPPAGIGLDGNAWMMTGTIPADQFNNSGSGEPVPFADDLRLINWLNANIRGTPVVAEASIGPYRGNGSRISSATGLPTVIGWERHEEQQRDRRTLPTRVDDVRRIYTSTEPAQVQAVLDQYHVRYIVVGDVERKTKLGAGYIGARQNGEPYASAVGLATLEAMAQQGMLTVAWQSNETILYRVVSGWAYGDVDGR